MATTPPEPTDGGAARELRDFLEEGADVALESPETSRGATGRLQVDAPLELVLPDAGELVASRPDAAAITLVITFDDVRDAPPHPIAVLLDTPEPGEPAELASEAGFVGTVSFFGADHHDGGPTTFRLEASRAVTDLDVAADLTVTLVPMPEPDRRPEGQPLDVEVGLEIAESRVER